MQLGGSEIQEMNRDALPHRTERIDRRLLQRLISLRFSSSAIAQATRASRRAAPVSARELMRNRLDSARAWALTFAAHPPVPRPPARQRPARTGR